jgi:hypothetical protein
MDVSASFGKVRIPLDEAHQQTGIYTSVEWKVITSTIEVKLYSRALGNPLFEEVESKNYSSRSKQKI